VRKVHSDHPDRPAIDWDLMLLLQPMTIAGALIGVDLNKVLPEILLLVHMLTLLTVTARETTKQGGASPAFALVVNQKKIGSEPNFGKKQMMALKVN
jgi:uncharacterized membrane protein YfcA